MDSGLFECKVSSKENESENNLNLNSTQVFEEEDDESKRIRMFENRIQLPLTVFFLTFLFPPLGFIFFLMNKGLNRESRRYAWFRRALSLGSALSVIYTLVICVVLHHTTLYKWPTDMLGYGYE